MPENQYVLDFWHKLKGLGADLVFKLLDKSMTAIEAENLLERLAYIDHIVNQAQRDIQREEEKRRQSS